MNDADRERDDRERERANEELGEAGGGGMTGATGSLTPDDATDPFVPAELREIADPGRARDVTAQQRDVADERHPGVGDPEDLPQGDPTNYATRDAGYGSEHGLSPEDPNYEFERHPSAGEMEAADEDRPPPPREDGDEHREREERF